MIPVIDVSYWQGAINFDKMKAAGVQGVIVRAGRRIEYDTNFLINIYCARMAGLKIGAYWFIDPTYSKDPRVPARMLASMHKKYSLELPPMMDVEWHSAGGPHPALTGPALAQYLKTFSNTVKRNSRRPSIYTNVNYWNPNVGSALFGAHDLVLSKWISGTDVPDPQNWDEWAFSKTSPPVIPMGWTEWDGWQFSANDNAQGAKYGVSSIDIDLNIFTDAFWKNRVL